MRAEYGESAVLMWSYAHAYMTEEGNTALKLFELVQKEAYRVLEKLIR
jgi:hypothetical protein